MTMAISKFCAVRGLGKCRGHQICPQVQALQRRQLCAYAAATGVNHVVTTPIFYVNSAPHVGHLYTSLLADSTARYYRLTRGLPSDPAHRNAGDRNSSVILVTGTDEHGQKVAEAARASLGCTTVPNDSAIRSFVDGVSESFQVMGHTFQVRPDDFVRTTQRRHIAVVRWLWRRLLARGALQQREYAGWYCRSDEAFLTDIQTCTRGEFEARKGKRGSSVAASALEVDLTARVSSENGHSLEWVTERNWVFTLTEWRDPLLRLYDNAPAPGFVYPPERASQMRTFIAGNGLQDLSVSRPSVRVPWAIPVPDDPSQSVYVWLDALANYLTACRGRLGQEEDDGKELDDNAPVSELFPDWPLSPFSATSSSHSTRVFHVVGKDIAKFHAVYWPAFLMAAGLAPPAHIITHAHFTVDHVKMSKSLGNVVDPMSLVLPAGKHAPDAVRYFLLREGSHSSDADYNTSTLEQRAVKECAGTFGNLAHRIATAKFVPLGRVSLAAVRLDVPWTDIVQRDVALVPGVPGVLEHDALPPLGALAAEGTAVPTSLAGHAVIRLLPSDALRELWPEPYAGTLPLSPMQMDLLRSLHGLKEKAGTAYGEVRPAAALSAIMAVLQEANRVHFENAPWKISASADDIDCWRKHAVGLLDRAGGAVRDVMSSVMVKEVLADVLLDDEQRACIIAQSLTDVVRRGILPAAPPPPIFTDNHRVLAAAIYSVLESLRLSCVLLQPAMPSASTALLGHMGFDAAHYSFPALDLRATSGASWEGGSLGLVLPHHFCIGRHAGTARTNHPLVSGPCNGPVVFPQQYELKGSTTEPRVSKRKNALRGRPRKAVEATNTS